MLPVSAEDECDEDDEELVGKDEEIPPDQQRESDLRTKHQEALDGIEF
jgi:hypothetical protein